MAKRVKMFEFRYHNSPNGHRIEFSVEGLVIALFLGLVALVCLSDPPTEPDPQLVNYCEMVRIHKASGDKAIGWPDFKGIYSTECRQLLIQPQRKPAVLRSTLRPSAPYAHP